LHGVIWGLGPAFIVKIVEQADCAPKLGVFAKPLGISSHGRFDGQHVTFQAVACDILIDKLKVCISIKHDGFDGFGLAISIYKIFGNAQLCQPVCSRCSSGLPPRTLKLERGNPNSRFFWFFILNVYRIRYTIHQLIGEIERNVKGKESQR